MALSVVRRATGADIENLNTAWNVFRKAHEDSAIFFGDEPGNMEPRAYFEHECAKLRAQWYKIACRALGEKPRPVDVKHMPTIAYGNVGYGGY